MNNHTIRQEYFELFQKGKRTIFIIIAKSADKNFLKKSDIIFRKLDDRKLSILGWVDEADAQKYLELQVQGGRFKVCEITADTFRTFLSKLDVEEHKLILLELI